MTRITVEITKVIIETVEAKDFRAAGKQLEANIRLGDYDQSFHKAEPHVKFIDSEEIP